MIILFVSRTSHGMKYAIRSRSLFTAACTVVAFLSGCRRAGPENRLEAKAVLTVELISPETAVWPEELAVSGRVEAWQESVISSEVNGPRLDEVLVNVGEWVKKGQLLARFNDESAHAKLTELEADVRAGEATLTLSKDQLARSRRLVVSGAVSEEILRQNEATVELNEAELASARARLSAQRIEFRHTHVTAPDDGVVSSRTATTGTVLASGSELFRLIRQNRLEWRAEIPAADADRVIPGQTVLVDAGNGGTITGTVRQLAPTIDTRTLNAICYVDLPAPGTIKAGMFLSGTIQVGKSPSLHVPESAIVYRDGYTYVIVVWQDYFAHQIKVSTARRREEFVEIEGNVSESDRLILSGGSFVNEGDTVRTKDGGER